MAQSGYTPIVLYYTTSTGTTPSASNLVTGELALNAADGTLFYKNSTTSAVAQIAGGGGGASAGGAVYENTQSITANYTMTTDKNGESVGPITVSSGVTVTIPAGSRYVIL